MGVSKVEFDGTPVMDITDSTVTEDTLEDGVKAYNSAGNPIIGRRKTPTASDILTADGQTVQQELDDLAAQVAPTQIIVGDGILDQSHIVGVGLSSNSSNKINIFVPLPIEFKGDGTLQVIIAPGSTYGYVYGAGTYAQVIAIDGYCDMGNGVSMVLTTSSVIPSFNGVIWAGAKIIISKK